MSSRESKYAAVALRAADAAAKGENPVSAWESAAEWIFPESPTSQQKSCPKSTFLGLAEAGELIGVPTGIYTRSEHNKRYALTALNLIRANKSNSLVPTDLWLKVMHIEGTGKQHNAQMDVVIGLWHAKKIVGSHG